MYIYITIKTIEYTLCFLKYMFYFERNPKINYLKVSLNNTTQLKKKKVMTKIILTRVTTNVQR